jgi:hypothetical protein
MNANGTGGDSARVRMKLAIETSHTDSARRADPFRTSGTGRVPGSR